MIVDSHCHLDYPELFDNLDSVVKRAFDNNISNLLTICTNLDSFEKIKFIVNKYNSIYGTVGIHPHETNNFKQINAQELIKLYKSSKKIIGIGETGLDYYYNNSERNVQKKSFEDHIDASIELNLPIIVHTRDAEKDTYEIIKNKKKNTNLKVLIHCFTGTKEFSKKLLDLNCYISVSGIITFKNAIELTNTISFIPMSNLLVETDSPYLAPVPYRGKPNEPSFLKHTIKKLSEIKKISENEVIKNTTNNFFKLFNPK